MVSGGVPEGDKFQVKDPARIRNKKELQTLEVMRRLNQRFGLASTIMSDPNLERERRRSEQR